MTYESSPLMRRMTLAFLRIEGATQEAGGKPGFPPAIGLAVSACESAWWRSETGKNNYFGITRAPQFPGDPESAFCATSEYLPQPGQLARFRADERDSAVAQAGKPGWYWMHRWFAVYPTLEAAVGAYVLLLIDSTRYHPAWIGYHEGAERGDSDLFLKAVCAAGYATGPAFQVELQISHQQNILQAVASGRAELAANSHAA